MTTQNSLKKYLLLTIISGVVAIAPQLSKAAEIQTFFNGEAISSDESQDTYLKDLVDNLRSVESAPEYQKALADLKASTQACSSLPEWRSSKPDLSGNFIVRKNIIAEDQGNVGPVYIIILSFPQVSTDTFNVPIQISSNPFLLTNVNFANFLRKTLETVKNAALTNRLACTRMATDDGEKASQRVSSNN